MNYSAEVLRKAVDQIAEQEDEFEKKPFLRNDIPREFIKKYLKPFDTVLDAGGGAGINTILMANICERVTLIDISPKILELAQENIRNASLAERIEIVEADITDLHQFKDGQFSFVVCVGGALSHVLDKRGLALNELARVAREGSILILGFDSKYGAIRHYLRYQDDLLDDVANMYETSEWSSLGDDNVKSHLYTVAEVEDLAENVGCEILELASTPTIINSLDESKYREPKKWQKLKNLELKACTQPELLGIGSHLLCVAKKI